MAEAFNINRKTALRKTFGFLNNLLRKKGPSPGSAIKAGLKKVDIKIKAEFEIVMKNKAAARLDFTDGEIVLQYLNRLDWLIPENIS